MGQKVEIFYRIKDKEKIDWGHIVNLVWSEKGQGNK